ncbi:MAG: radical SAM protein [Bacillota bacterium]
MGIEILFVYPDFTVTEVALRPGRYQVEEGGWYAEGLAAMAASLQHAGHRVALLHLTRPPSREEFLEALGRYDPALVGLTVRSSALSYCAQYTAWVKEVLRVPVVWGGYHPTLAPEECMAFPGVDGVCLGEGDEAVVELADALAGGRDPSRVRSMWFHTPAGIVRNPVRPLVEDLDLLPLPEFGIFERSRLQATRARAATAMVSRGCPFRCGYCSNHRQRAVYPNAHRYPRFRSPAGAIAYLRKLLTWSPGTREIRFLDNVFGLRQDWLEEFCDLYRREIGLPFACNQRPDLLDRNRASLLAAAGCRTVYMGIESGDPQIRRVVLGRPVSDERMVEAFRTCREVGMSTVAYNMIGLPGEDRSSVLATARLNARARPSAVVVSVFSPYPGTDLYEISVREGYVHPPLDYRARTFLDQPGLPRQDVLLLHLFFRPLVRLYRLFGPDSAPGRMVERALLWRHLPARALVRGADLTRHLLGRLRYTLQNRLPGVYRLLRTLKHSAA